MPTASGGQEVLTPSDAKLTDGEMGSRLEMRLNGGIVRVGQLADTVFQGGYKKPAKSTPLTELPPDFDAGFVSQGWETPLRHFSTVLVDDRVVLALDHWDIIDSQDAQDALDQTISMDGKPESQVIVGSVNYSFWTEGNIRLMVLLDSGEQKSKLTMAIGLVPLMDRLRMDPASATEDAKRANEQYKEQAETKPEKKTS